MLKDALNARIKEFDFECAVGDGAVLADELVEPLSGDRALSCGIDIGAVVAAGWRAIDSNAEAHRLAVRRGAEHEMKIAGMEPVNDAAAFLVERGVFSADRPVPREPPLVKTRHTH